MQGYGTLVREADQQLKEDGVERPTHVFVQAGVGSLAGAVVGYFANKYRENPPVMAVCEASAADCLYRSAVAKTGGLVVQDTAWEGYEEIPAWIMQGYGTLVREADQQLKEDGVERPTHVFVQAGVGSLAGAVVGYFANKYRENPPVMAVCEASAAVCLYRSAVAKTGGLVNVTGDLQTIMAGLACGEGNTIGWDILKNHVTVFASCPDWMSAKATRIYANPLEGDPHIVSGESGSVPLGLCYTANHVTVFASCPDWMSAKATRIYANPLEGDPHIVSGESGSVPLGLCYTALHDEDAKDLKEALKLDENSVVLVISTEGDTDPVRYKEIVWDGLYGTNESLSK